MLNALGLATTYKWASSLNMMYKVIHHSMWWKHIGVFENEAGCKRKKKILCRIQTGIA